MADQISITVSEVVESVGLTVAGEELVTLNITEIGMRGPEGPEGPPGPSGTSQLEISTNPDSGLSLNADGELESIPVWSLTDW